MEIISRKMAIQQGLLRYFTGKPCKHGHSSERYTKAGHCTVCAKNTLSLWCANNPELAKETRAKWRLNNAEKDRSDVAKYQALHKEKLAEAAALWSKNNPEKRRSYSKKYRVNNPEKALSGAAAWRSRNRDKVNAKKSRRIASKLQATPSWANPFFVSEAYHLAKVRGRVCGGEWHVDHIVPIRSPVVCGLHCEVNLRVIPGVINQTKGNRHWPDMPVN